VHDAGISVCSGGILGLGESDDDRIGLIWEVGKLVFTFALWFDCSLMIPFRRDSMPEHPESFPVNALVPIEGTPLEKNPVRTKYCVFEQPTARVALTTQHSASPPHHNSKDNRDSTHCFTYINNKARSRAANVFRK
jgi:biotin synthase